MNKTGTSQKRVMSASLYSQKRQAPYKQKSQRKRFGRLNTQSSEIYQNVKGNRSRLYTSAAQMSKVNDKMSKAPQQLLQQNFLLRNELKDVNSKLYLTRTKIESHKKKHLIYAKKLNRQFQKELYWENNKNSDYLITGVKYQYQKLKQSYQQKCQQLQMVRKTISSTQIDELTSYCDALQTENKILIEKISYMKKNKKKYSSAFLQNHEFQACLIEFRQNEEKYKSKIKQLQQQIVKQSENQIQLSKKLKFLQKLTIEKQNDSYHSRKKVKAIEREKTKLLNQLKMIEQKISNKQKNNTMLLEELQAKNQRQAQVEKSMFQKLIRQKNTMIEKLQKEIGYLSTLLSYWKPLDEFQKIDRLEQNSSHKDNTITHQNQSFSLNAGPSRQLLNRPKTPASSLFVDEINQERYLLKSVHNQEFLHNRDLSFLSINKQEDQVEENPKRQPRRSTKKWAQGAKKCRKVQLSDIQQIGELIRYKMIAHKISPSQMKEYFSCALQRSNSSKLQEELITMKQLKETLVAQPFELSEEDAFLVSRYVIEDEGVEYVFCHEGNELQRSIAKSIVKTLVGEYSLPDEQKCEARWKQIKRIYCHNLQLALKTTCSKGIVTKNKLFEMIKSLGIELEEETKNYLAGKLVKEEKSLKALKYDILFTTEQRI